MPDPQRRSNGNARHRGPHPVAPQNREEHLVREEELRRLNRMMNARARTDQAVLRAKDEQDYVEQACRIIIEECGHAMAWIGYAEQDARKTVRPVACAGFEEGYLQTLKLTWADSERGRGPVGTAIRTGALTVCNDVYTDPRFRPWRREAMRRGYGSLISLPLQAEGKTFGAVTIYAKEPNAFTEQEIRLLFALAGDLGFGIGTLRTRAARKLAEAHFQQAQRMEAVGLLAGGIAHDFNNILAIISGYTFPLLEELKPGNPLRAYCVEIQRTVEVGGTLTHQLLGLSGNRGGKSRILDPNSVILQMMKMLRRLLAGTIRLEKKLHRSVWPVRLNSGQLEQIILNLAVNARDAMPKGGRLTLTTRNLIVKDGRGMHAGLPAAPGRYVVLEVADTGTGMPPEVQAHLFEPFFTTKGPGRGTGLGLSTLRTIIDEHHGHIAVESRPGQGTTFRVFLPSVKGGVRALATRSAGKASGVGQGTILLVEDNESLLKILKRTLEDSGYTVHSASTGGEMLSVAAGIDAAPDLLLSDVVLPDLNGPELAKSLKERWPGLKIVYMSGYPGNALGPTAGFSDTILLEKPFSLEHLLDTLREVLARKQTDLF